MPLFEFQCKSCNRIFEELVSKNDEVPPCPHCMAQTSEQILSSPKLRLGGGSVDMGSYGSPSSTSKASGCAGCSGGSCGTCG